MKPAKTTKPEPQKKPTQSKKAKPPAETNRRNRRTRLREAVLAGVDLNEPHPASSAVKFEYELNPRASYVAVPRAQNPSSIVFDVRDYLFCFFDIYLLSDECEDPLI